MSSHPGFGKRPLIAAACLAVAAQSLAAPAAWQDTAALARLGAAWLEQRAGEAHPQARTQVQVTPPDSRLRLKPCAEPAFRLAEGSQPWGQGSLGVRCSAPEAWDIYLAYHVKLTGPALVSKHALVARQALSPADVESRDVEYRRAPGMYLQDAQVLRGATLTMPAPAGTPLRIDMLRRPPAVRAGERVGVLAGGAGFEVRQEAVALQAGSVGDLIRLKTQSGRIIQATVTDAGQARVAP